LEDGGTGHRPYDGRADNRRQGSDVANENNNAERESRPANLGAASWLGIGLIVLALLLAHVLVVLWPADLKAQLSMPPVDMTLLGIFSFKLGVESRLLLLVMTLGATGSFIHAATSFSDFVGNQKLTRNWFWWYGLRPFIGAALALIVYLAIRGGLLGANATGDLNLFGVAALAGLVGMFTKQATDKLNEVFTNLFRTAPGEGDSQRKDELGNPVPVLNDLNPIRVEPQTHNLEVEALGAEFVRGSLLRVGLSARETEYRGPNRLVAKLLPEDVEREGELEVTVFSPGPGGGISMPLKMRVAAPQLTPTPSPVAQPPVTGTPTA
jgi:hypothetical protein